jgi:pyrroloquinoline-quinone synthase
MAIVEVHPRWQKFVDPQWLDSLRRTALLERCYHGTVTRGELSAFVREHYYYSRHFTRFLAALMGGLEREDDRGDLARNLFEEMGLDSSTSTSHSQLYRQMMVSLGVTPAVTPQPETDELVRTMFDCCRASRPVVGLGALGVGAEAIVPFIYSLIVAGFESLHEPPEHLVFFKLHIACDDAHAETMHRIALRELERDSRAHLDLRYGAEQAIAARIAFFQALGNGQQPTWSAA